MPFASPRSSSGIRLTRLVVVLMAGSVAFTVTNLALLARLSGDHEWVNLAGRRRMLAWQALAAAGERAVPGAEARLGALLAELGRNLEQLVRGEAGGRLPPPHPPLARALEEAGRRFETEAAPLLRRAVAGGDVPPLALAREVEAHVIEVDRVLASYTAEARARHARLVLLQQVFLLLSLVTLGVFLWILRDANRRLERLVEAAAHVARGEFSHRAGVTGDDEIAVLGRALDDMAERRARAEAELRASQARFAEFMRHLPAVAFVKDGDGRLLWANPGFERSFALAPQGWTGRLDSELWPAEVADALRARDRAVLERGEPAQAIESLPVAGVPHDFLVARFPVSDPATGQTLLGGVAIDVSEPREAERRVRDQAARYQAIVNLAVESIITIDEHGVMESVNPATERMFGWSAAEMIGRNVSLLMPSPYREEHDGYLAAYLATGQAKIIGIGREVVAMRKDGSLFPMELAVSEVPLAGRRIFTGSIRDLTQRRRTEVLAQTGILASGLAHEIGTPMNVILGRAELVRDRLHDPALGRHLDVIVEQVERIARLMNQLLSFARPHAPERRPTDLNRVVESAVEVVQERLARRRIRLVRDLAAPLPLAEVDPDQVMQLALNLVLNAIDAVEGSGELTLATAAGRGPVEGREADYVELRVSDTGTGIPAANLPRIFTPFFTTKDPGRGTGLGLSVVQGIVRDHGGDIRVESEVGRGTTFRVRLPLRARP